jgi:DNA-binding transcriptional LysR family regulator
MQHITLRQFQVFLAVARAKSFRRGAEALHLSQPALSQHVAELERALGARLFDRLGRSVILTEAGRILEDHALRLFATLASARESIGELGALRRGSLVVGASTTPGIYVLPAALAAFQARYPGITLSLQIANSAIIEERVRANDLDLGVVGGHALRPGEECLAAGLLDELALIVPPGHPWAGRGEVAPARLAEQRLLMREEGSATRQVTERALQHAGIRLPVCMELGHNEAIKQAVMAGLGVAFVSFHAVGGELASGRLSALRLRGLRIRRHFHVIHNEARTLTASARAFIDLLEHTPLRPVGSARGRRASGGRHASGPTVYRSRRATGGA